MDDGKFRVLLHMLKTLGVSTKMENGIIRIIDAFKETMTEKQLAAAKEEFARYEKLRESRLDEILEEEKYRELVHRQPFKEDMDWEF